MFEKTSNHFYPFKIRSLTDQRFLTAWVVVSFLISVALTAFIAIMIYVGGFIPSVPSSHYVPGNAVPPPARIPPWEVFGTDKLTFILLGYDEVDEFAHRSDTLMVGAVDFIARTVKIISIPRDTLVYIPRYSFMKVNSAYALGGDDLVRRTVEKFTGVDIDYVVSVSYQGFTDVVDSLGGVDITVHRAMHYDDNRGDVHIHIEAGDHHFDGVEALNYARFRMDAAGDLGRIERQQTFLTSLFSQGFHSDNWIRLADAAQVFIDNVGVTPNEESPRNPPEIQLDSILSLIGFLAGLDEEDITFHQIQVVDIYWQGLSCLVPIYSQTGSILQEVFEDDAPVAWNMPAGE